jgi:ribosomal protein S12 methylthiotransferase accessory factor
MEFSRTLQSDVKISLADGVTLFRSDDGSLFLKLDNKLSKIESSSVLAQQSMIFQILKRPRRLEEIVKLMTKFKRKDVIAILKALHQRSFITIQKQSDREFSKRSKLTSRFFLLDQTEDKKLPLVNSQILLIGNGFLADRLIMTLEKMNVKFNQIKSLDRQIKLTKKSSGNRVEESKKVILETSSLSIRSSFRPILNKSDLIIVVEDYQNIALFDYVNKLCFEKKKSWIRMSFDDDIGYLGPLVVPGKTSCFNCCELRLVTNSPNYEYELWRNKDHIPKTKLQVPEIFADFLSTICAREILRYLARNEEPETIDNLIVFDTHLMNYTRHKVLRHPNCIYCNAVELPKKVHSESLHGFLNIAGQTIVPKRNSHSSVTPTENELVERLRKLIDIRTGVIQETKKIFIDSKLGINSHYFLYARCSKPLRIGLNGKLTKLVELGNSLVYPSPAGSGLSPNEAEIRTLMEAVERYSNMVADDSRFTWSTYNEIKKIAIDPQDMGLYLDETYDKVKRISKYSPDAEIPWIKGQDLYSGKPVFIAADFVHYPAIRSKPIVLESSNGASAHTDIVQAILNGLYELIERDAFLTMWLNKIPMPILDIKTLPNDFSKSIRLIRDHDMSVKLVDLTNDSCVPTVMAVCYNNNPDKYPAVEVGTATHVEPERAVQKALFEMETGLIHNLEEDERKILEEDQITAIYEHAIYYLNPKKRKYWEFMISSKQTSKLSNFVGKVLKDQNAVLMEIVKHFHTLGRRVVYVDITPPDIRSLGLVAVKVFVTGFQPMYSGKIVRLNLDRLHQSAEYVLKNIGAARLDTEINTAPHPLA